MYLVGRQGSDLQSREQNQAASLEGPAIVCRDCRHPITDPSCQIQVDGDFYHTFANPQGHVFEIGCFDKAAGCAPASPPFSEFSWFPGYLWKIGICRNCAGHVGWIFVADQDRFFGLILDRLIFP